MLELVFLVPSSRTNILWKLALSSMIFPQKMLIFWSHLSLPKGIPHPDPYSDLSALPFCKGTSALDTKPNIWSSKKRTSQRGVRSELSDYSSASGDIDGGWDIIVSSKHRGATYRHTVGWHDRCPRTNLHQIKYKWVIITIIRTVIFIIVVQ